MKENIIGIKTIAFAIRIVKFNKYLITDHKEYILSRQLMKSGTAIGALVREAEHAESKPDFVHKMSIALKEANETDYWLLILKEGEFINEVEYNSIQKDCSEIIRILASIVKSTKKAISDAKNYKNNDKE